MPDADWLQPLNVWRSRQDLVVDPENSPHTIGLAASFTADSLVPYVGGALIDKGWRGLDVVVAPYNQLFQTCLNPSESFDGVVPDTLVLLCRLEDMFPTSFAELWRLREEDLNAICADISQFVKAVSALRNQFSGALLVCAPPYPNAPGFQLTELRDAEESGLFYRRVLDYWQREIGAIDRVISIDTQSLISNYGFARAHDARKWYLYRQPYTDKFLSFFGRQISRYLYAGRSAAKKCIVLDCDNTLWGGVVGELGVGGIALGNDYPGSAFLDFQKQLLHYKRNGIFLAIASKNNSEDVNEVFEKSDAMLLSREDISVFEVHWNSKVDSIRAIAGHLNIGLDSLVFIDDSDKEIGEVSERLPEVTCLQVPEELADLPSLLRYTELFDSGELTNEDQQRVSMMAAEQTRTAISENLSEEEFKRSLALEVQVFEASDIHLARVTQLINKTNQFNMTTIRRNQDEVAAFVISPDSVVLAMEVRDRFGDYGLVGVAILKRISSDVAEIDTLLMSCRVLGRGVERAFISSLALVATDKLSVRRLNGMYTPTRKNSQVSGLFSSSGFSATEDDHVWTISVGDLPAVPEFIKLTVLRDS